MDIFVASQVIVHVKALFELLGISLPVFISVLTLTTIITDRAQICWVYHHNAPLFRPGILNVANKNWKNNEV